MYYYRYAMGRYVIPDKIMPRINSATENLY